VPLINTYKTLFFDLDGTLTDPKTGITKSVLYSLRKIGICDVDIDSLVKFIGPPLKESYMKYYGFDDDKADLAISYYREYFSVTGIFENALYQGIDALLQDLQGNSIRMLVTTTKPTIYATKICEHFAIFKYFSGIAGSELNGTLSDKGDLIKYTLKKYSIQKDEVLMIGDREHDILGAKNNGLKSIGVGYGYGTKSELVESGATYYADTIGELSVLLTGR